MKLQQLTTELQTLCHEGYSECDVVVKIGADSYPLNDCVIGIENDVAIILMEKK